MLYSSLFERYKDIKKFTELLCEPLEIEDFVIQSMPDMSPTKWHLAHTSWFFETFVLMEADADYKCFNNQYAYLFNSYYVQAGERWFRPHRGLLSRPTVKDVFGYRKYVDDHMINLLENMDEEIYNKLNVVIEIGLNHEQQHQELMLTDIKHLLSMNPLYPVYRKINVKNNTETEEIKWISFSEGIYEIGYSGENFFYDNENPVHKVYLNG